MKSCFNNINKSERLMSQKLSQISGQDSITVNESLDF